MLLSKGEVIAVPTDTVYGLVCDLYSKHAVEKIFELKRRPANKPLVAFCKSIMEIEKICCDIPDNFYLLAEKYFPGPLTIVLRKKETVPDVVTCGMDTIAVRIPDYKFINNLLDIIKFPLASTSANISDKSSNYESNDVINTFFRHVPLIIDGGKCPIGIESTVIDLSGHNVKILREGFIKKEQFSGLLKID